MPSNPVYQQPVVVVSCTRRPGCFLIKTRRILLTFMLLTILLNVCASGLAQKITFSGKDVALKEIFAVVKQQTGHVFVYKKSLLSNSKSVTLAVKGMELDDFLRLVFKDQRFTYSIAGNTILVKEFSNNTNGHAGDTSSLISTAPASSTPVHEIRGRVEDDKGNPLEGVSVRLKGTNKGTATDALGRYVLQAESKQATLVFTFVGYGVKEVPVNDRSVVDVTLTQEVRSFNEVVVVGYGTQRSRDITGSVGSITSKSIRDQPVSTFGEALAAKIAGVSVQQTTGKPGAPLTVRIRGAGSISAGNQPLYVVDGFPIADGLNLNMIANDDIASIEVLKDASAAAIYGSRGGNGVVLITTKKGVEGKPSFTFNAYSGRSSAAKHLDMMNAREFVDMTFKAYDYAYVDGGGDPAVPVQSRNYNIAPLFFQPDQWVDTDWQKVVLQSAPFSNYQLSASGGNNGTKYYISGSYLQQDGIVSYTNFKRYSLRSNLEIKVSPAFKIGLNLAPSFSDERASNTEGSYASATNEGIVMLAVLTQPFIGPYQADGSYTKPVLTQNASSRNPLALLKEITDKQKTFRTLANLYLDCTPVKGLTLRTSGGADIVASRRDYFRPTTVPSAGVSVANGFNTTTQNLNLLWENTANYKASFGTDHHVELLAGYTAQWNSYETNNIVGSGYPNDLVKTVNAATTRIGTQSVEQWALASFLARLNYNYDSRYLLTVNFRRDGSSRFGLNTKWGSFPSASVGWRLSEEHFMRGVSWLSDLKLRASYGLTGNNNIANYGSVGLISQNNYVFGTGSGTLTSGLSPGNVSNPDLKWEKNLQTDIGLEAGLLKDRIQLTVDLYRRVSSDLLLNLQVPSIIGFTSALVNIGKVENKGIEFTVNSRNLNGALQWNTGFNISFNRNKVLNTGPSGTPIFTGSYVANVNITQIGSVIGSFYGYDAIGVFNNTEELNAYPHFATARPGDVKYRDVNNDKIIDAHDMTIIGNNQPDFIYGLTNSLQYKAVDLNIVVQGVQGNEIGNAFSTVIEDGSGGGRNQMRSILNSWQSPQQPGDGKHPRYRPTGNSNLFSSRFVEDGSYFRLRTVTLGYTIPANLTGKIRVKTARCYFSGENIFTVTKYSGFNPEVSTAGDNATQPGIDYGAYPISRVFTLGVNIGF